MSDSWYVFWLVMAFALACIVWPDVAQSRDLMDMIPSHQCSTDMECEAICLTIQDCDVLNNRYYTNWEK